MNTKLAAGNCLLLTLANVIMVISIAVLRLLPGSPFDFVVVIVSLLAYILPAWLVYHVSKRIYYHHSRHLIHLTLILLVAFNYLFFADAMYIPSSNLWMFIRPQWGSITPFAVVLYDYFSLDLKMALTLDILNPTFVQVTIYTLILYIVWRLGGPYGGR